MEGDIGSGTPGQEPSMGSCCVCPFCPPSCLVVWKTRKILQEHVKNKQGDADHDQGIVPTHDKLEWVTAEKVIHNARYRWVRTSGTSHQIGTTNFSMPGFRYQSRFEAKLKLLSKHDQFVEGGSNFVKQHPGFETQKIGKGLQFYQDAFLFLQRCAAATKLARYKLRQFAKRDEKGMLKVSGFSCLYCNTSMNAYARTLARFIFYAINSDGYGDQFQAACKTLRSLVAEKRDFTSEPRFKAVEELFHASLTQLPSESDFSAATFVELFYAVAPQGFMNRTACFVRHAAVHLIYGMRGGYILTCQSIPDKFQHRALSDSFLNEQNESAYASLQSLKRVAASCLETLDCNIQWTTEGDAEVITRRGNVVVSQASMEQMYKKLLRRCHSILDSMNFPVLSLELIRKCHDPSSKVPGEGIMSMNSSTVFQSYCDQHSQVVAFHRSLQAGIKAKKNFCSQIYSIGKALIKALYFAGGPSARLSEISSWIVSNTDINHERNVRFLRGSIAIVNTYSKQGGAGMSQGQQKVVSFADEDLTSLVLTYLIVLKNFEMDVVKDIPEFGQEAAKNSQVCFLIDKGKPLDGTKLGRIYREEFLSSDLDVTIGDMRQVLESYARKTGCLLEPSDDNPLLWTANHTARSSNSTYGKSLNVDLPGIDADRMEVCWNYSQQWNRVVLGSEPKTSVGVATTEVEVLDYTRKRVGPDKSDEIHGLDLGSEKKASVVRATTALEVGNSSSERVMQGVTHACQEICRSQSQTQAGLHVSLIAGSKRQCIQSGTINQRILREKQALMMDHLDSNRDHHSLYILPTGSGKTKVVIFDCLDRRKCNVLFVPLVSIKEELMNAGESHSDLYVVDWSEIQHDFSAAAMRANIVVVSFEHAGQGMISFIQCLHSYDRLGYCFVDEVDVLLQEHRSFGLFWSLAANCQLVRFKAMTATLRPRDKVRCEGMLGVKFNSELRFSCKRDEVVLSCRFFQTDVAVMAALNLFVAQILSDHSSRILIFCMAKAEADSIGETLEQKYPGQVSICHSDHRSVLKRVSVVTSCVQSGINEEGLSHVIVLASAWSVEGLVQVCFFVLRLFKYVFKVS